MKKMWHLRKMMGYGDRGEQLMTEAVVFDDGMVLGDYRDDGFEIEGTYNVELVNGNDLLPSSIEEGP